MCHNTTRNNSSAFNFYIYTWKSVFLNTAANTALFSIHSNVAGVPQTNHLLCNFGIQVTNISARNTTELNSQPNVKTVKAGLKCDNENTKYKSFSLSRNLILLLKFVIHKSCAQYRPRRPPCRERLVSTFSLFRIGLPFLNTEMIPVVIKFSSRLHRYWLLSRIPISLAKY